MEQKIRESKKIIRNYLLNHDDITDDDHGLFREAVINDRKEIIEVLLTEEPYLTKNKNIILDCELLKDTIKFFANDEINDIIKDHFSL